MSDSSNPRQHTKRDKMLAAIVIGTAAIYTVLMLPQWLQGGRCCDSTLVSNSFIRQAIMEHSLDSSSALPPRCVRSMLLDGTLGDHVFRRRAYEDTLDSVVIRGRRLSAIGSSPEARRAVLAELQLPQEDGEWEELGRFRFSMEPGLYDTFEPHVIVAVSCYEEEGVLVGFADVRVQSVGSRSELREMIELDEITRNAIGFPPLAMNLEYEINTYRADKGLPLFTD